MRRKILLFAMTLALLSTVTCMSSDMRSPAMMTDRNTVESMVASWPDTSRKAAMMAMDSYGVPDGVTPTMLVWNDSGPWKRTIVYMEEIDHGFPVPHKDVWEQFIDYDVPVEMFDELARYDGSVIVERTKGEMSARCDKEGANFLAINLANDIVTGKRTVEEARMFYAQTMKSVMNGEKPPYVSGFMFDVPQGGTKDSDHPVR